jgi:hypothetical protein
MGTKKWIWVALLVLTLLSWFVVDYLTLPAYNLQSFGFWFLLALYFGLVAFFVGMLLSLRRAPLVAVVGALLILLVAICASATSWLVWPGNADRYFAQLPSADRDAAQFVKDFPDEAGAGAGSQDMILPRTDKQLSTAIAQGKLGSFGARFRMDLDIFTAMTVRRGGGTEIIRATPLDYTGFLVALTGGSKGTAGYIEVNQETEEGRLVTVEGGMRYTPGAILGWDLDRHVRFAFRGRLLGPKSFEIDDSGRPYWVVPVIVNRVGLFGGADSNGIILADPTSGETKYYAPGQEPSWVDRSVPTEIVTAQANNRLRLGHGWINAILGEKRDVFQLSDSYNYVVSSDADGAHTWMVSGITSPSESDQSLAGFLMVNMRTKEARRYGLAGITEMRAMEIAQSDERVRAQTLEATWPILVDLGGEPVYYLFLKNAVQRQRFVYIDLATGQKVAMGETLDAAKAQFLRLVGAGAASRGGAAADIRDAKGQVLRVKDAPEEGGILFLLAGEPETVYVASPELSNGVRFLAPGDRVELRYSEVPSSPGRRFVTSLVNRSIGQ